jgi:hypothetical protein
MKVKSILSALILVCVGSGILRAQWLTQTLHLRAGWNAVYLHVDPSHATIDEMVALDPSFAVEEVWMWRPDLSGQQFSTSPLAPTTGDSRWLSWSRQEGEDSQLQRMAPGVAYLVRINASIPAYDWNIQGKPVAKRTQWTSSGLNFLGFPIPADASPTFRTDNRGNVGFFGPAPLDFLRVAEFYKYDAGDLGPNNPAFVYAPRTTRMARGEAYWIKSGDYYNRYFGPVEISSPEAGQLFYGDKGRVIGMRIRNVTSAPITVNLSLLASETAPAGQPTVTGIIPLIIREARTNAVLVGYPYSHLVVGTPHTWTLAAAGNNGSDAEIVLGIDRSQLTGNAGDLVAGVLRFTDSLGLSQTDVGVSGNVGSYAGLWIGDAVVTQVGQYLKKYERDTSDTPVTNADGTYKITSLDTSLTGVSRGYPLRLIVHNPASGSATLLQQVYVGMNAATNPVVARFEGALNPSQLRDSRRISAPHLPYSSSNTGWAFSGPVNPAATVTATVTTRFDDGESNPFLHAYHPDHDNLDSDRAKTLSQGSESYSIVRALTLQFLPPADHFDARTSSAQNLTGNYAESVSIKGLARGGGNVDTRTFETRGSFSLQRITDVPVLSSATTP